MPNCLENSYLRHILIAVEAQDHAAPFRTFFDSWFAFKEGGPFLNANSRPHWFNNPCPIRHAEALRRAHFVSARAALTLSGQARERLMKDHAIPVSVLRDMLLETKPNTIEEVRALLLRYFCFGIITDEEDRRLNAAGLRSRMPDTWTDRDDIFARYEKVAIVAQNLHGFDHTAELPITLQMAAGARSRAHNLLNSVAYMTFANGGQNG